MVRLAYSSSQPQGQKQSQLGGRLGEQVGNGRHGHAPLGAEINIEVVMSLESARDELEVGAGIEQSFVDAVGHEGQDH
jgi:hypothetical protein